MTRMIVTAGGGGVGKTTTSAALAMALARQGHRTLALTVDPARRLADALGVEIGAGIRPARTARGGVAFDLAMPAPDAALDDLAQALFTDPREREAFMGNGLYATLADAPAGMHEILVLLGLGGVLEEGRYDAVVLDTAPSRHALDFLAFPGQLAELLSGASVGFFASFAQRAGDAATAAVERSRLLGWGKARLEEAILKVLPPEFLVEGARFFADLGPIREPLVARARRADALLREARFLLVSAPTRAARQDALRLAEALPKPAAGLLLNRADDGLPPALAAEIDRVPQPAAEAAALLREEAQGRRDALERTERALRARLPTVPLHRLPTQHGGEPLAIVEGLAPHLEGLARTLMAA
ncbi:MAG: ArsA-related P-loop ATPase [Myxococcota bacterium]